MTSTYFLIVALFFGVASLLGLLFFIAKFQRKTTQSKPVTTFKDIAVRAGFTPDVVLHVAASLAQASDSPSHQAIVTEVNARKLPIKTVEEFKVLTGYGLTGMVDGRIIALGSPSLMTELGIDIKVNPTEFQARQSAGTEVIYVSINSYLAGIITVSTLPA